MTEQYILVVNLGSSSGKFSLFKHGQPEDLSKCWSSTIELDIKAGDDALLQNIKNAIEPLWSKDGLALRPEQIRAIGHRVVHGGSYVSGAVIDEKVKADIHKYEEFAPLHNHINLSGILCVEKIFGKDSTQVAVFDTTFHHTIPEHAARYALPYDWFDEYGIKRYGFHGISHAYASARAAQLLGIAPDKFNGIICHLGSGCSITAVQNGKSIDTSMGFTPLEGLMMGTRSGSIDPGIIFHLIHTGKHCSESLVHTLNYDSGLSGVSGLRNDMRTISKEADAGNERAKLAIEMFVYRLQSYIGSYYVHLQNPQALVFTGGIGEHSSLIREKTVSRLAGIRTMIDTQKNDNVKDADCEISDKGSEMKIFVIEAREDLRIAKETADLM